MSTKLILTLLVCITIGQSSFLSLEQEQFEGFIKEYGKEYTVSEYAEKFEIFTTNLKRIEELNSEEGNTVYGINEYADMSQDEFRKTRLMPGQETPVFDQSNYLPEIETIDTPDSYDWRDHGAVTPVWNQGGAGTCWVFSTTGNIEGIWKNAGHDLVKLSEQQYVECDATIDHTAGSLNADCGVQGGWPYLAMTYTVKVGGVIAEEDYKYCVDGTKADLWCDPCSAKGYDNDRCGNILVPPSCNSTLVCRDHEKKAAKISDWKHISTDEAQIAAQLATIGPLSVALNAWDLQFYKKGVFNPKKCNPAKLDHAVLIVGYGTDSGKDFWIVKNSWGAKWGESGFFRIMRGTGECGINTAVVTGIV